MKRTIWPRLVKITNHDEGYSTDMVMCKKCATEEKKMLSASESYWSIVSIDNSCECCGRVYA